ncbi:MAG TPA: diacylglycerol kinase family protein [Candidatus Limiplasma sp.]|nr:diacylglycerol kinase family protein [Candidatus Limiplasma sp.]
MGAKNRSFISGFLHALEGLMEALITERSLRIHAIATVLVVIFGFVFHISLMEWIICVTMFGLVIGAELGNTAIENTVDICCPNFDPRAKRVKDIAAAAVLMVSIAAGIVGLLIFVPKVFG